MKCDYCEQKIKETDNRIEVHKGRSWTYHFCSYHCLGEWMACETGLEINFNKEVK